ncbi:hypothetical protein L479_02165 [Exiguobacterium sp. S17]|nr:hypothetical protein L479_02165 [Exiguobacterium sp. S17]
MPATPFGRVLLPDDAFSFLKVVRHILDDKTIAWMLLTFF